MSTEKVTTLFKLSKTMGLLQFIVIARKVEDGAVLITRKGYYDGAEQEDIKVMEPKNVGRANETTPWQQAILEHTSKVNKLLDKGYKDFKGEVTGTDLRHELMSTNGTDANGNALPMLAQKDPNRIIFPCAAQKKFNGLRCISRQSRFGVSLRSRRGKFWDTMDHIRKDLEGLIPKGLELDGELFHEDFSLQMINSRVKRNQPGNEKIKYRVYDIIGTGLTHQNRIKVWQEIARKAGPSVVPTLTYRVKDWEQFTDLFHRFLAMGYEGIMARRLDGLYETGKRSYNLIKYKSTQDAEFKLIGMEEATGRDEGTAVFVLQTKDGKPFNSRPMGTREIRREYWENPEKYIGKLVTIRFQELSDDGIPVHSRALAIRDSE